MAPRLDGTIVFDPAARVLYLFGGASDAGTLNDLWSYSLAQRRWAAVDVNGNSKPAPRLGHTTIFDPVRRRIVVFGGQSAGFFNDTWAFDIATGRWSNLSPYASARSLRRCLHHAVYDKANHQMLLYGGCANPFGPCPLGDLWVLDLASNRWSELASASNLRPPAREALRRCL